MNLTAPHETQRSTLSKTQIADGPGQLHQARESKIISTFDGLEKQREFLKTLCSQGVGLGGK